MEGKQDAERIGTSVVSSPEWCVTKPTAVAASADLTEVGEETAAATTRLSSSPMSDSATSDLEAALRDSGVGLMETKIRYISRSDQQRKRRTRAKDKVVGASQDRGNDLSKGGAAPALSNRVEEVGAGPPPHLISPQERASLSDADIPGLEGAPNSGKKGPDDTTARVSAAIERSGQDAVVVESPSADGGNIRPGAVAVYPTGVSPPQSDEVSSYHGNSGAGVNPYIDVTAEAHLFQEEESDNGKEMIHIRHDHSGPLTDGNERDTDNARIPVATVKRISPITRFVQDHCFLVSMTSLLIIGGITGLSAYLSMRSADRCEGDNCTNSFLGTSVLADPLQSKQPTESPTLTGPPSASLLPSHSPTTVPTSAPTLACSMPAAMRTDGIVTIVEGTVEDRSVLQNNASAHHRALTWLAQSDAMDPPLCPQRDNRRLEQRFGLALLHFSLGGDPGRTGGRGWSYMTSESKFLEPINECDWAGVDCNSDIGFVRKIELAGRNLRGMLPTEIFTIFDDIRVINLQVNRIEGCIPEEVGLASRLENLHLSANALGCTIPPNITNLFNLRFLDLSANVLFGSLPSLLGNLVSMQHLDLSSNSLRGPFSSSIGSLSELKTLHLHDNEFSSSLPLSIFGLPLSSLRLNNNEFDGNISPAISNLSYLEELYLHRNRFSGHIPQQLVELPLRVLTLSFNRLRGVLPKELGQLSDTLEVARLERNRIIGAVPSSVAQLSKLGILFIHGTNIDGIIGDDICALRLGGGNVSRGNLRTLKADCTEDFLCGGNCGVCCSCCECVDCDDDSSSSSSSGGDRCYRYGEGTIGDVENNRDDLLAMSRSDTIRQMIVQFNVSEEIALSQPSSPQGKAASWIIDQDELKIDPSDPILFQRYALAVLYFATDGNGWLRCSATDGTSECGTGNFKGKVPFLSNVSSCEWAGISCSSGAVRTIRLEYNSLRGTLPTKELSGLCLQELTLRGNTVSIDISSSYNERLFSSLYRLDLSENALAGKLSKALFSPRSSVYLNGNRLSGSLPSGISYSHLYSLRLQYNDITGTIPAELGSESSGLRELRLDNNFLTGTVPVSFGEFVRLRALTLHYNEISGTIPDALCDLSYDNGGGLEQFWVDCAGGAEAEIECNCCSRCF